MFEVVLHELAGTSPALAGWGRGRFLNKLNTNAFLGEEMRTQNSRFRKSFHCPNPLPPCRIPAVTGQAARG